MPGQRDILPKFDDAGLPRMLIREIAKDPKESPPLMSAAVSLIWVASGAICLLSLYCPFLHFGTDVKIAALVMSFATWRPFHAAGYSAVLRAFEDNELNYLGYVLHRFFYCSNPPGHKV